MADALNTPSKKSAEERFNIGNFELLRDENDAPMMLGKGTFGRTYKARHRFLDTIVALKVINERYVSDPIVRQRFLVEGRAVARLSHPHIARLHDFGEADGALYYAMEFCSGGNLASHVSKHDPLDVAQLIDVAIQVAGALECAHTAGFVHRDVKPSNIMLTGPGLPLCAKLIDFGLVHATTPGEQGKSNQEDAMAEGRFIGTPLFASPEQLREQPVDGRTDLFSLGMTLWYLAVGGPPEPGTSAEIAASRLSSESYAPRLPKTMPDPLRLLLARLLEKDITRRVKDVGEVLAAFKECAVSLGLQMTVEPVETAPASSPRVMVTPPLVAEPVCPPAEVRSVARLMESELNLFLRDAVAITGSYYSAKRIASPEKTVLVHVLYPELVQNAAAFNQIRVNVARIRSLGDSSIIQPDAITSYSDQTIIVMDKPTDGDLPTALRAQGVANFPSARPFLEAVAIASDRLRNVNLPGVDLRPGSVFLRTGEAGAAGPPSIVNATPMLLPRFLTSHDTTAILGLSESVDATSTMTSDTFNDADREEDPGCQFASLIYRIVSGRNCPAAASLSPQGYVAVPGLSEQANRILSLVVARQSHFETCADLLYDLLGVEGVSGSVMPVTTTSALTKKLREVNSAGSVAGTRPGVDATNTRSVFRSAAASATKSPVLPLRPMEPPALQPSKFEAARKLRGRNLVIAAVLAVAVVATGVIIFNKQNTPRTATPLLPESLVVQLQDDLSIKPAFEIANKAVAATHNGGEWQLPLREAAPPLPFEITVEAVGYDTNKFTIHNMDELSKTVPLALNRSTGKILFIGIPVEYTQASCLMKDALPEEKDHVDVPKYAIGTELHGDATPPFTLPTGIYLVNLKGRSAPQRWPVVAAVKGSGTFTLNLPPLVEGRYSGQVSSKQEGEGSDDLEINVVTRRTDGWIKRGNEQQALVEGRINTDGAYLARALASATGGGDATESTILMRPSDGGSYDVYVTHSDATEAQNFTLMGTVHRSSDQSAGISPNNGGSQGQPQPVASQKRPLLEFFPMTENPKRPGTFMFESGGTPVLRIFSFARVDLVKKKDDADYNGLVIHLNEEDRQRLAELSRSQVGKLFADTYDKEVLMVTRFTGEVSNGTLQYISDDPQMQSVIRKLLARLNEEMQPGGAPDVSPSLETKRH